MMTRIRFSGITAEQFYPGFIFSENKPLYPNRTSYFVAQSVEKPRLANARRLGDMRLLDSLSEQPERDVYKAWLAEYSVPKGENTGYYMGQRRFRLGCGVSRDFAPVDTRQVTLSPHGDSITLALK